MLGLKISATFVRHYYESGNTQKRGTVEVFVNEKSIEIDREVIKISDLLGLLHVKRVPRMTISVNGKPIRHTLWIKYPLLDGDRMVYHNPEETE